MRKKYTLSATLLLLTVVAPGWAQMVEVPLDKKFIGATVLSFKEPYETINVFIEDDLDTRYSVLTVTPKTLLLKRSLGMRKVDKLKSEDQLNAADIRPGMRIDMRIDHFQRSLKNEAKEVVLAGNYYGSTSLKGLYEFYDGQKASVDGQLTVMGPGAIIKGADEWRDKSFASFGELQLGCELTLQGKRETDGVVYVTRGTARPIESDKEDRLLRRGVGLVLKLGSNKLAMGSNFTRTLVGNDVLSDYVNSVGRKVVPEYLRSLPLGHPDHIDFNYYLVEDETLNASAMPDGTVVLHTAMLRKIDNEAQLAAILGHEIAHITQKHHAKNYRNRQNWNAIQNMLSVASLASGSVVPALAVGLVSEMYVGKYDRNQETQADRIGLRYMYDAGYDAREAAAIWRKLAQDDQGKDMDVKAEAMMLQMMGGPDKSAVPETDVQPEKRESLYASHPRSRDRFNHVNFLLSTTYANVDFSKATINAGQHAKMLDLLNGKTSKPKGPKADKPKIGAPKSKGTKPAVAVKAGKP